MLEKIESLPNDILNRLISVVAEDKKDFAKIILGMQLFNEPTVLEGLKSKKLKEGEGSDFVFVQ